MHQDVLSAKFCGEGAPDWAIETGGCQLLCEKISNENLTLYAILIGASGFPEPVGETYPIDPDTGYPLKKVTRNFRCSKN